jgi:acyl-CoA synthetase (AMP-forming)/AMP-acid ligase II
MLEAQLIHELVSVAAARTPEATALVAGSQSLSYGQLDERVRAFAAAAVRSGLQRGERVGIYLEKRLETVVASFGAPCAGAVFVPMNPLLKPEQVVYIANDCQVRVLVTSPERLALLEPELPNAPSLRCIVLTQAAERSFKVPPGVDLVVWNDWLDGPQCAPPPRHRHRHGRHPLHLRQHRPPQGRGAVHRNMVAGAKSVASYLDNRPTTRCWPRCRCPSTPASAS